MEANSTQNALSLVPLGAGDLIDRAVRFYRRNFWTFILIAAPPIVVGTAISVGWSYMVRAVLFGPSTPGNAFDVGIYYFFLWVGGLAILFTEIVLVLSVMGGASRNFVRHLLFGEAITFRETYKNTLERFWGLFVASSIIAILLGILGLGIFYFGFAIGALLIILAVAALAAVPPLAFIVGLVFGLATMAGTVWLFFLIASRFAYVPQVMLVEGQGVFSAIARSAGLASGNVKRLIALFFFSFAAIYSALALFYVPLLWYAWAEGIDLFTVSQADTIPVWYEIASQLVWQASLILLLPVLMVGLCILYVDERVRHEGYDIELMAARRLGDIPSVPSTYVNPLQPALSRNISTAAEPEVRNSSGITTLGLK